MSSVILAVAVLIALFVLVVRLMTWFDERDYHAVEGWAQAHSWACFRDSKGGRWTGSLPKRADRHVKARVEGILREYSFTLVYALIPEAAAVWYIVDVPVMIVIVHLPSAYPKVNVMSRTLPPRRSATGTVGHPEFDRKFRVRTEAPGGPEAVIPSQLADAHVAGTVPLWSVQDRELICVFERKQAKPANLDAAVDRAVQVADLLGPPRST